MNFVDVMPLISAIFVFILGLMVFLKNKKARINFTFFIHSLAITAWLFCTFMMFINQGDVEKAIFWDRFVYASVVFIPVLMYHFGLAFVKKKRNFILYAGYIFSFVFLLLSRTEFFVDGIFEYRWGVHTKAQFFHHLFLIYFVGYVIIWFFEMFRYYRKLKSSILRQQAKYVFLGFLLLFTIGPLAYLPAYGIGVYPFSYFSGLIFTIILSYAIITQRLMDIKIVLRRSFVFIISFIAVLIPAFLTRFLLAKIFGLSDLPINLLSDFIILVPALIIFPRIKKYFFQIANEYFFSSLYDSRQVVAKLSAELQSTLSAKEIYESITQILVDSFHAKSVGFLAYDSKNKTYSIAKNTGFKIANKEVFKGDRDIYRIYTKQGKCIVTEEIKNSKQGSDELLKLLESMGVEIMVPLNTKNKTLGLIAISAKESGDIYGKKDLEMLSIIGNQAAISLENALLYGQVNKQKNKLNKFNRELQERVGEQTKEIRKKSQVLEKNNIRLKKMLKMRGDFLNIASHQLRTPVAVIKGMADVLSGKEKLTDKEKKRFLRGIIIKSKKLAGIVHDILSVTEMDSDKFTLKVEPTDIKLLLERMVEEKQLEAKDKKIKLKLDIPKQLPLVLASERYLEQAIVNLINNALVYTEKGSVTVKASKEKGTVLIQIIDTGIGISKKDATRLFDKFVRARNATSTYTDGTGLGLFITKKIIDGHKNAKVWIEKTQLGKGTTFTISLPSVKQKA